MYFLIIDGIRVIQPVGKFQFPVLPIFSKSQENIIVFNYITVIGGGRKQKIRRRRNRRRTVCARRGRKYRRSPCRRIPKRRR